MSLAGLPDPLAFPFPVTAAQGGTGLTSYTIGDMIYASGAATLAKLADVAVGSALISGGVGAAPSWSSSLTLLGIVGAKPATTAGIQLDPNAATGNFTLSLSPANITGARRWSFPDRSDTVAGLAAQTFGGIQTFSSGISVTGGSFGQGYLYYSASLGTVLTSKTGSTNDFYLASSGGNPVITVPTGTENVVVSAATAATSTTAGALVVTGGAGIGGALYALALNSTQGTITTAVPAISATTTWNAGGITFAGAKLNVTDTASAAASLLLDLQVGGVRKFSVRKDGALTVPFILDEQGTAGTIFSIKTLATNVFTMTDIGITGLTTNSANTSTVSSALGITSNCSGTVANGFGTSININLKTISAAATSALVTSVEWADAITASYKARAKFTVSDFGAARECLRLEASGTAAMIGFLGSAAVARPSMAAWTGTATRTTFATSTATLANVAEALKALIDDLRAFGLEG